LIAKLFFFGNNENQLAPDTTINEIKRLWIDLRDLGLFPGSECTKRAKRDEDRYTFFVTIEQFFKDVNRARSFVQAKKEKAKQKEQYLKELDTPAEPEKEKPTVRKLNRQESERRANIVIRRKSGHKNNINPETPQSPTVTDIRRKSGHKNNINPESPQSPTGTNKSTVVLTRKKKLTMVLKPYRNLILTKELKRKKYSGFFFWEL